MFIRNFFLQNRCDKLESKTKRRFAVNCLLLYIILKVLTVLHNRINDVIKSNPCEWNPVRAWKTFFSWRCYGDFSKSVSFLRWVQWKGFKRLTCIGNMNLLWLHENRTIVRVSHSQPMRYATRFQRNTGQKLAGWGETGQCKKPEQP